MKFRKLNQLSDLIIVFFATKSQHTCRLISSFPEALDLINIRKQKQKMLLISSIFVCFFSSFFEKCKARNGDKAREIFGDRWSVGENFVAICIISPDWILKVFNHKFFSVINKSDSWVSWHFCLEVYQVSLISPQK